MSAKNFAESYSKEMCRGRTVVASSVSESDVE